MAVRAQIEVVAAQDHRTVSALIQLGDVHRYPLHLMFGDQLGRRSRYDGIVRSSLSRAVLQASSQAPRCSHAEASP